MKKILLLIFLCVLNFELARKVQAGTVIQSMVTVDSAECTKEGEILYCDYKNSDKEAVYMGPLPGERIKKAFLYNIRSLSLDISVSLNLSFHDVKLVKVENPPSSDCKQFELSAKNTNFEEIPDCISSLYLEDCRVQTMRLTSRLSKLDIHSSLIDRLHMSEPLANGTVAVIQSSQIRYLKNLRSPTGSTLLMKSSTVDQIDSNGIDVEKINMKDSTIKSVVEGSSVIFSGGRLEITNFKGKFAVITASGNDNPKEEKCERQNFVVLFSLCFILLVCSWLGFIAYLRKNKLKNLVEMWRPTQYRENPEGAIEISSLMPGENITSLTEKNADVNHSGDEIQAPEKVNDSSDGVDRDVVVERRAKELEQEVKNIEDNFCKAKKEFESSVESIYQKIYSMNLGSGCIDRERIQNITYVLNNGYNFMKSLWAIETNCKNILHQIILKESISQETKKCHVPLKIKFRKTSDDLDRIFAYMRKSSRDSEEVVNKYPQELRNSYVYLWKNCKKAELALENIVDRIRLVILNSQAEIQEVVLSRDKIHIQSMIDLIYKKIHEIEGR